MQDQTSPIKVIHPRTGLETQPDVNDAVTTSISEASYAQPAVWSVLTSTTGATLAKPGKPMYMRYKGASTTKVNKAAKTQ